MFWSKKKKKREMFDAYKAAESSMKAVLDSEKVDAMIEKLEEQIKEKTKEGLWDLRVTYYRENFTDSEILCVKEILANNGYEIKNERDSEHGGYHYFTVSWLHLKFQRDILS